MPNYIDTILPGYSMDINTQLPISMKKLKEVNKPMNITSTYPPLSQKKLDMNELNKKITQYKNSPTFKQQMTSAGISAISSQLGDQVGSIFGDDTDAGRIAGTVMSTGISSIGDTFANNALKGSLLTEGLGKNLGGALAGAGAGLAANYIGQGVSSALGNSSLGRGIGAGLSTGLGTIGGSLAGNIASGAGAKVAFGGSGLFSDMSNMGNAINPYALGASVIGSALGAAAGPSKEYGGRYGNITQTADTIYDSLALGANFIPGIGQGISAAMVLNKGLSNIFGSTDGMTKTDAILGTAFMPAPVKWLNMADTYKTGTFNKQSWQNSEKTKSFMQNGFGNLQDRFDLAREEAGKTYGTFSRSAGKAAQRNIDFANKAWTKILNMSDQNILQNIKASDMSSINNQKYAQMIQGGFRPIVIGKIGMKILNNATNHNIGMRLLSGAALIDNKQMILCSAQG